MATGFFSKLWGCIKRDKSITIASIGASFSALVIALWTFITWQIAEAPKYAPIMTVWIDTPTLTAIDGDRCSLTMEVHAQNNGHSILEIKKMEIDIAIVDEWPKDNVLTYVDRFPALSSPNATHVVIDHSADIHTPFLHTYPPGDASQNPMNFLLPAPVTEKLGSQIIVYRARVWTNKAVANANAFSWGVLQYRCKGGA